ncbi:hypothetical protein P7D22_21980, partial [Lichenihabitans sp. Uapishka_5]|uniref:hypothetical protein n=1 Tax=Lichenihabitans sp. Uapishka_5 TaxID=3037302 RepID=UPI0029E7E5E2
LTSHPRASYKAFIDGGAANELAAGAAVFCFFWCLAFTAEWLKGRALPVCWAEEALRRFL